MSTYTTVPNDLKDFLTKLPGLGVPPNKAIDQQWLAQVGFTTPNQRSILNVLKAIEAIDGEGRPTKVWNAFRARDRAAVAIAIREAYADLFTTFSDADKRDDEAIANFYRGNTSFSANTLSKVVRTFRVLTEFGDFDSTPTPPKEDAPLPPAKEQEDAKASGKRQPESPTSGVHLTVNIQLQIPATAEGKVYEELFAAMRKNLIDLIDKD
jgi:hypothetical protein